MISGPNSPLPSLASDNYFGVHPEVLAEMTRVNEGPAPAYGSDAVTEELREVMRRLFASETLEVFPVFNGTGANVTALASLLRPFESILCAGSAHIAADECGAVERATGCRVVTFPTPDGKLTPELLMPALARRGDVHHAQPRVITVSQSTEYGTVYTCEELQNLAHFAHENGLLLHVDGSRASNAVVALSASFAEVFTRTGVDVLSLGATKNGAMAAEALIYFRPDLARDAGYFRKQATQLASKQRFVSAQLLALFRRDLWRENAAHANGQAARLAAGLATVPGVELAQTPQANAVFVRMPAALAERLMRKYSFYSWNTEFSEYRLMTSFATPPAVIDGFLAELALNGRGTVD